MIRDLFQCYGTGADQIFFKTLQTNEILTEKCRIVEMIFLNPDKYSRIMAYHENFDNIDGNIDNNTGNIGNVNHVGIQQSLGSGSTVSIENRYQFNNPQVLKPQFETEGGNDYNFAPSNNSYVDSYKDREPSQYPPPENRINNANNDIGNRDIRETRETRENNRDSRDNSFNNISSKYANNETNNREYSYNKDVTKDKGFSSKDYSQKDYSTKEYVPKDDAHKDYNQKD